MSTQYGINGYVIPGRSQTRGIWLLKDTEYAPALAPRRAVVEVPGVHYALPMWNDPMGQITVGLRIRVQGDDADDLRTLWNTLTGLLGSGTNAPVVLSRIRGENTETADAQLVSSTSPDFYCSSNRADVQLVFNIPGGAWRGNSFIEQNFTGTATSTAGSASTMPITDALIRLPGPVGALTVTDIVSGTAIEWTKGTVIVPGGNYLLIDPSMMVAKVVTTTTWDITGGTNVSGRLVYSGLGPFTITSSRSGPSATVTSSVSVSYTESPGPVRIRARAAVV